MCSPDNGLATAHGTWASVWIWAWLVTSRDKGFLLKRMRIREILLAFAFICWQREKSAQRTWANHQGYWTEKESSKAELWRSEGSSAAPANDIRACHHHLGSSGAGRLGVGLSLHLRGYLLQDPSLIGESEMLWLPYPTSCSLWTVNYNCFLERLNSLRGEDRTWSVFSSLL